MCLCAASVQSCPTLCDSMDFSAPGSSVRGITPGKNTGVGCHALFQGSFPTQGLNPGLLHCKQFLSHLSNQGRFYFKIIYHKRRDELERYFLTSRAWMPFPPISFAPPLGIYTGPWPVQGRTPVPQCPPGAALRQVPQWFTGSGGRRGSPHWNH